MWVRTCGGTAYHGVWFSTVGRLEVKLWWVGAEEWEMARAKWNGRVGTTRARARVGRIRSGWGGGQDTHARICIYIYIGGWVRRSIHTAALHQNDRKHGVFIPGAKDKNADSINHPPPPPPPVPQVHGWSALHPFDDDDAPKSCGTAEEATVGDAHTAGTRRWWARAAATGLAFRALLRTSERNARATTTAAAAASTVDIGAAARFACPERRAPHTNTVARIIHVYVHTRTGNRRAARYRFALYTTRPHTHAQHTHTHTHTLTHTPAPARSRTTRTAIHTPNTHTRRGPVVHAAAVLCVVCATFVFCRNTVRIISFPFCAFGVGLF